MATVCELTCERPEGPMLINYVVHEGRLYLCDHYVQHGRRRKLFKASGLHAVTIYMESCMIRNPETGKTETFVPFDVLAGFNPERKEQYEAFRRRVLDLPSSRGIGPLCGGR